jgi:hypothetical protein
MTITAAPSAIAAWRCDPTRPAERLDRPGGSLLRPYDRSIEHTVVPPVLKICLVGILGSRLFIDVDAEPRLIIGVDVALPDFRRTGKHLARLLVKKGLLLNSEVRRNQVEVQIVTVADRIDVIRSVPRRAHVEEFAAVRHLSAHIKASHR